MKAFILLHSVLVVCAYGGKNASTQGEFQNLAPVCGDCWCVADPVCPNEQVGFSANFSTIVSDLYTTFILTNTTMILQANDGGDCYPFAEILAGRLPETAYSQSFLPQCQLPESLSITGRSGGYCAFVFDDTNKNFTTLSQCQARQYSLRTFETLEDIPSHASLTHAGSCGVCSSAQDLSRRVELRDRMVSIGALCVAQYYLKGKSFENLIQCIQDNGYTYECSKLWAHYTATSVELCTSECLIIQPPYNGDPPECKQHDCLTCTSQYLEDFEKFGGRTQRASGITEDIAWNCSDFYPVIHDPCPGVKELDEYMSLAKNHTPSSAQSRRAPFPFITSLIMIIVFVTA